MTNVLVIKALKINISILFNLAFAKNTIYCAFLFFRNY